MDHLRSLARRAREGARQPFAGTQVGAAVGLPGEAGIEPPALAAEATPAPGLPPAPPAPQGDPPMAAAHGEGPEARRPASLPAGPPSPRPVAKRPLPHAAATGNEAPAAAAGPGGPTAAGPQREHGPADGGIDGSPALPAMREPGTAPPRGGRAVAPADSAPPRADRAIQEASPRTPDARPGARRMEDAEGADREEGSRPADAPARAVAPAGPASGGPVRRAEARPLAMPAAVAPRRSAPPALDGSGPSAPARVTVQIGRIEVKAPPPPAPPAPAKPAAGGPTLSLQDYVRRRDGGWR